MSRPALHFTSPDWINDPYGVHHDGERYHVYFQTVPGSTVWSPRCAWGHASSTDLVHWRDEGVALAPGSSETGCWSGSVTAAGAFYTRVHSSDPQVGQIALAVPDGSAWRGAECLVEGPPDGLGVTRFRDPFVWAADDGWRMIVGASLYDTTGAVLQYRSSDARRWTFDGVLCSGDGAGPMWECPALFPHGDGWALLVSVVGPDGAGHVELAHGDYDGSRFRPRRWRRLTYGASAYAMTTFLDTDGRRCVLSWLRAEYPGQAGVHSLVAVLGADGTLAAHPNLDGCAEITRVRWPEEPLELGDELRLRAGSDALVVERPGLPAREVPCRGVVDVVIDADVVEVYSAGGCFAGRLRPGLTGPG